MKPSTNSGSKKPANKASARRGSGTGKAGYHADSRGPKASHRKGKPGLRAEGPGFTKDSRSTGKPGLRAERPGFSKDGRSTGGPGLRAERPGFSKDSRSTGGPRLRAERPGFSKDSRSTGGPRLRAERPGFSKDSRSTGKPGHFSPVPVEGKTFSRSQAPKTRGKNPIGQSSQSGVRLNRYIANSGVCSRREADELISSGAIKINGKIVTELGTRLNPGDSVTYKGKKIKGERKVYVLLNKPKDCVTTVKDTHGRKTVMDLVEGCCPERIYPVGRLDRNTTGVLLLTNDGELAEALSHPSYNKKKIYHIHLEKPLTTSDMQKISEGFELDDGFIRPDGVDYVDNDKKQVGMEIHSGRNRIVRRMFESMNYKVMQLDRVFYAGMTKKGIPRGHWRHLTLKEVGMLKMSVPGLKKTIRPAKP